MFNLFPWLSPPSHHSHLLFPFPLILERFSWICPPNQRWEVFVLFCFGGSVLPFMGKEIKPVNPKGSQLWIFIGRTDSDVESPILCPPDVNSQLTEKDPVAGKDQEQEKKGETEDEMVRYHHQLNGHKFEQTPGDSRGQRSLVCCSPWGCKDSDTLSNWTAANFFAFFFGVLLHLLKFYPVPFAS